MMLLQLRPLAPLDRSLCNLRVHAMLDEVRDRGYRLLHELRDTGIVEKGSGCVPNVACAKPKQEEVVDELLVLRHAKLLCRESGFYMKVPNPLALVSDVFRHKLR